MSEEGERPCGSVNEHALLEEREQRGMDMLSQLLGVVRAILGHEPVA